jgi:hypothetical protein
MSREGFVAEARPCRLRPLDPGLPVAAWSLPTSHS